MGHNANEHYSIEAWTDFARGLNPDGRREAMQAHLDSGCDQCRRRLQLLVHTREAAAMEAQADPPEWVVERALELFPSPVSKPASDWIRRVGEILFDSWLAPALAGLRAGRGSSRQLRYRADDLEVELQMERGSGGRGLQIVGLVSTSTGPQGLGKATIDLCVGDQIHATECNGFGEFQIEVKPTPGTRLLIHLPDRKVTLELTLPD